MIDTCLVYGNTMPESEGGGIGFSQGNPKVTIRNTTITGNSSANAGAGLKVGVSQLSLVNCIVSGNKMGETEDNVSGTLAADSSNNLIDGDPKFKDAEANDYRLGPGSPAQNAGVRYEGLDRDLDNVSFAKKPSMGCYERRCGLTVILK